MAKRRKLIYSKTIFFAHPSNGWVCKKNCKRYRLKKKQNLPKHVFKYTITLSSQISHAIEYRIHPLLQRKPSYLPMYIITPHILRNGFIMAGFGYSCSIWDFWEYIFMEMRKACVWRVLFEVEWGGNEGVLFRGLLKANLVCTLGVVFSVVNNWRFQIGWALLTT